MKLMPQEIEIWYIIPALRRELAKSMIANFKLTQKEVSQILGITESAVSQYLKAKRANELKFSEKELEEIRKTTKKIILDKDNCNKYVYELTTRFRGTDNICKLHRKYDKTLSCDCKICVE